MYHNTGTAKAWTEYQRQKPKAKLICVDIAIGDTCQIPTTANTLNVGGLNDSVFKVIAAFTESTGRNHWQHILSQVQLG